MVYVCIVTIIMYYNVKAICVPFDHHYRRDFRLLVRGDDGSPIVHPVLWSQTNITSSKEVSFHGNKLIGYRNIAGMYYSLSVMNKLLLIFSWFLISSLKSPEGNVYNCNS